jgi:hypothetical protein
LLQVGDFSSPSPTWSTIAIGPQPVGVALTPDDSQVWVANSAEYAIPADPGHVGAVDNTATPPTLLGTPIAAGSRPTWIAFATLSTGGGDTEDFEFDLALKRIKILQRGRHKDYFWIDGKITLDPSSDGLDPAVEHASLMIGASSFDIPAGSFLSHRGGLLFTFRGRIGETWLRVMLVRGPSQDKYRLITFGKRGEFPGIASPVTVGLVLGNDSGEATKKARIR